MSRTIRTRLLTLTAAAIMTAVIPGTALANTSVPTPVGPNQYFTGWVNGHTGQSTILTDCVGPTQPGQNGHPLPNQSVEVRLVTVSPSNDMGYTGSAATAILVSFSNSSAAAPLALRYYDVRVEIPTTVVVPCSGSGLVTFTPYPTSTTARRTAVAVTYVGLP